MHRINGAIKNNGLFILNPKQIMNEQTSNGVWKNNV